MDLVKIAARVAARSTRISTSMVTMEQVDKAIDGIASEVTKHYYPMIDAVRRVWSKSDWDKKELSKVDMDPEVQKTKKAFFDAMDKMDGRTVEVGPGVTITNLGPRVGPGESQMKPYTREIDVTKAPEGSVFAYEIRLDGPSGSINMFIDEPGNQEYVEEIRSVLQAGK